ncbi:phenylalanine--tRNA ligase subunit beta [Gemella haemolysans]|uniref:Phenylalanine--tRNA ligase beta subunit n=1 Tax=Gemella haemolysans ATCC 10379 TaxID=546270 RepID=C5NYG4_9BACL|nr:phenylalanine--tRNA ligase subunit beta [Gemella haemolysans]EER67992.1 phenylalanine--tRNA ligase, beta subunit [Gemella haemolysans ATCC 10379]KAA8709310.1 phenylalanine--tRNA ligase subunit beta [Gemella haemolysans]UBH83011.1 phenylalanine--tRNA ligase subunit beta [Gemella haemolysans]VEI38719.1 Phenylalanine--tRNA ligase beta subunit [Gemella haemolysans]
MLVSYNWLKQYTNVEDNANALAEKITRGGIEVEGVEYLAEEISNVVVGYVVSKEKHPDAEKLNVCQVNVGEEENLQIVCGAPNVDAGQYVIVAKVGAKLPGIKIKKAKLRGVESQGMICSLAELGLSKSVVSKNYQEGIYVFETEQELGSDVVEVLGLNDYILDLSITPNRADALSMRGLTYELGALYNNKVNFNDVEKEEKYEATSLQVAIESDSCRNYVGQIVKNVEVKSSPLWLQTRLMNSGIRPINNIVDITNYVLLEFGQPMHAFDKDLVGDKIVVRDAKEGEVLETLDGEERKLQTTDLVITDGTRAIALGGVMGGKNTEVSEETKNIILESAYFNPTSVRRTSAAHGLRSDSSARFEKGIDPNMQKAALARAVELILELCPNAVVESSVGVVNKEEEKVVEITTSYINNYLGITLSTEEIVAILEGLSFSVEVTGENLVVKVPTRRPDISIKQDLVEEVIRIYGYDNLASTLPKFSKTTKGGLTYSQRMVRDLRAVYASLGFNDTINYSLVSEEEATEYTLEDHHKVRLLMPMTETHSTLRQSLVPGLLNTVQYNVARKQKDLKLLEIGRVFFGSGDDNIQPKETLYLSAALTGEERATKWLKESSSLDFFVAKGYLEVVFNCLGLDEKVTYKKSKLEGMHPGRFAEVYLGEKRIGFIGEVHPQVADKLGLNTTYVFEINLDEVISESKVKPKYEEVTKYPEITRDIAMLVDVKDEYQNIYNVIESVNSKLITKVELFDLYVGAELLVGKKSLALTITYSDKQKTLTDEEVTAVHDKVLSALTEYGAIIR